MRYFWALVLFFVVPITSMAQQRNPMFFKEVLLQHKPYTLQSITEEIQAQSGISFSYDASKIDPNVKIKLKGDKLTVAAILQIINKKTDIGYKIISQNHIIYTESEKKTKAAPKPKKLKYRSSKSKTEESKDQNQAEAKPIKVYDIAKTSIITNEEGEEESTIMIVGDSNLVSAYYLNGGYGNGGYGAGGGGNTASSSEEELQEESDFPEYEWDDKPNRYAARKNMETKEDILNFLKSNTLFAAGISVDETYYLNPTLRMGFDFLYGSVSYNIGSTNTWRFGVGAAAKISDQWQIHFNISTGQAVSNNYDIIHIDTIPPPDSSQAPTFIESHIPLSVSSKLTRYSISANYNLGKGFFIEGGIVLNHLKTNYYSYGNPVTLSDVLPFGLDADSKYYGIKPPYVLGNSFSANATSNSKVWIGLQVTFLYRLNFFTN